jgi:hypothetical protein
VFVFELISANKSNPTTGLDRPLGFQEVEATKFLGSQHMKMVRLSALCTSHLCPPKEISMILISVKRLSQPLSHSAARKIIKK